MDIYPATEFPGFESFDDDPNEEPLDLRKIDLIDKIRLFIDWMEKGGESRVKWGEGKASLAFELSSSSTSPFAQQTNNTFSLSSSSQLTPRNQNSFQSQLPPVANRSHDVYHRQNTRQRRGSSMETRISHPSLSVARYWLT